jgi:hypothetical protein
VDVKPLDYAEKVRKLLKQAQEIEPEITIRTIRRYYNSCGYDFEATCRALGLRPSSE